MSQNRSKGIIIFCYQKWFLFMAIVMVVSGTHGSPSHVVALTVVNVHCTLWSGLTIDPRYQQSEVILLK